MVGKGTLGAFRVFPLESAIWNSRRQAYVVPNDGAPGEFRIGTGVGLTAELRQEIWGNQSSYLGRVVRYRYQAQGTKDAPRIPSFQGFRDVRDL
jgi:hypothetical protein